MKDLLAGAIIIAILGVGIYGIWMGGLWFTKKMQAVTNHVQVVELEGHKFIIVTSSHGVAVCPVPQ